MQTTLAVALKDAGIKGKPRHTSHKGAAPKRTESRARQSRTPSVPRSKTEKISLTRGETFVLVFSCQRDRIPEGPKGIQVLPAGGGHIKTETPPSNQRRFSSTTIDLDALMARVEVDSINVREGAEGWCRVYTNCIVGVTDKVGFNSWGGGAYEKFVRKFTSRTWKQATLRPAATPDGRTMFELRTLVPENVVASTKILFAIG